MSRERAAERIGHMIDAIAEIGEFTAGMNRNGFLADARTIKAVAADLSIIGEAARHVADAIALAHPEIPWALMRGMRNRIVHAYYQLDPAVVWDTAQNDLPQLLPLLRALRDELRGA